MQGSLESSSLMSGSLNKPLNGSRTISYMYGQENSSGRTEKTDEERTVELSLKKKKIELIEKWLEENKK